MFRLVSVRVSWCELLFPSVTLILTPRTAAAAAAAAAEALLSVLFYPTGKVSNSSAPNSSSVGLHLFESCCLATSVSSTLNTGHVLARRSGIFKKSDTFRN